MTDRELLKKAAKAAGYAGFDFVEVDGFYSSQVFEGNDWHPYYPLTDDGDALRLAVKLDISPRCINGVAFAWRIGVCDMMEPCGSDPYAATRRAIVRAAAAIGARDE